MLWPVVAQARDARAVYRALAERGWTRIVADGPCDPPPEWGGIAADVYLDFWARHTRPESAAPDGPRTWRIARGPERRPLGLSEPPGLVEHTRAAWRELEAGRPERALALLDAAQARAAGVPALFAGRALAHAKLGRVGQAESAIAMAFQRGGVHADLYDVLARVRRETGRPADAARALELAAGLDPGDPARWRRAARALLDTGFTEAALQCEARAVALEAR